MRTLLLPLLPFALLSCGISGLTGENRSDWYEAGPARKPLDEVVAATKEIVLRQGYKILPIDPASPRLETAWDEHLSPHWREGYRTRVEAEFEVLPGGGGVLVRVRSAREINNEAGTPTISDRAQWISAHLDDKQKPKIAEPAIKIRQLLKFKLETRS
jgi:hypothetical protein